MFKVQRAVLHFSHNSVFIRCENLFSKDSALGCQGNTSEDVLRSEKTCLNISIKVNTTCTAKETELKAELF